MVRNLRPGPTWIPGTIVEQSGPLSYIVSVLEGTHWKRHVDHLRLREDKHGDHGDVSVQLASG